MEGLPWLSVRARTVTGLAFLRSVNVGAVGFLASRMQDASQENKRLALASFESLSRKVGIRLLHGLKYLERKKSLVKSAEIGQAAVELLRVKLDLSPSG